MVLLPVSAGFGIAGVDIALYSVTNELVARVVGAAMLVVGLVRNRRRADGGTADRRLQRSRPTP